MSDVQATIKIMPESPEVDFDDLYEDIAEELPETAELLEDTDTEDVAFGLQALIVGVLVPDQSGGTEDAEEAIRELDDVESVSVESVGRV